jgi:hypothetical protein
VSLTTAVNKLSNFVFFFFAAASFFRLVRRDQPRSFSQVNRALQEPVKKKVGGSLARLDPLRRLEMLRVNARLLRRSSARATHHDDGSLVRKIVGAPR